MILPNTKEIKSQNKDSQETNEVRIICPICKSEKGIDISVSILKSKSLTTISIPKNQICEHHFQAFVDKDFNVRGYQEVDFEIECKKKLPKGDHSLKVILTGNYFVGKTSLIKQFVESQFQENYIATLGAEISNKTLEMGVETSVKFFIWDICGQIQTMVPSRKKYYDGANAVFIVVDRTRKGNLKSVKIWYDEIKKSIPANIPVIIIGNKSDLTEEIVITEEDIKSVADEFDFRYILTSAKTEENIDYCFEYIAHECL